MDGFLAKGGKVCCDLSKREGPLRVHWQVIGYTNTKLLNARAVFCRPVCLT